MFVLLGSLHMKNTAPWGCSVYKGPMYALISRLRDFWYSNKSAVFLVILNQAAPENPGLKTLANDFIKAVA